MTEPHKGEPTAADYQRSMMSRSAKSVITAAIERAEHAEAEVTSLRLALTEIVDACAGEWRDLSLKQSAIASDALKALAEGED